MALRSKPETRNVIVRKAAAPGPRQLRTAASLLLAAICVQVVGCPKPGSNRPDTANQTSLAGVKLRLLVVDDAEIAAAVGQLRGEWETQTGSELQVEQIAEEQLLDAELPAADVLICHCCQLGILAEQKLIVPLPEKLKRYDGGPWAGIFELPKLRESAWGDQVQAVPFGSPVFVCYYRADLLQRLRHRPPQTWADYQKLAEVLGKLPTDRRQPDDAPAADQAPWSGTLEPLGPGWAALVLLARAAPYAKHRDSYSALFDPDTMQPLVAGEPFLRALEELAATARLGSSDQLRFDPSAVRAAFWRGECGMALSWPTAADQLEADADIDAGFAELPGSRKVYHVESQSWESRPDDHDPRVPLLTVAGRLGVVSVRSDHREAAFELLFWLSGKRLSPQVCAASAATTLFRRSHLADPGLWVEKPVSAAAATDYADMTQETFTRQQWLFAPRIPGRRQYLAALDTAVQVAVRSEKSPAEALQQAARQWREITVRLGIEKQKSAYLHSLGLE